MTFVTFSVFHAIEGVYKSATVPLNCKCVQSQLEDCIGCFQEKRNEKV